MFAVLHSVELLSPASVVYCMLWKSTPRSKAPLSAFLESADSINQRSLIGLIKHFLRIRPATSPSACGLMLDFMSFITRLELNKTYKNELNHMTAHFDECMVFCLATMKKDGLPLKSFWQKHRKNASLLVSPAAVDRVLCEDGSWSAVGAELTLVSQSSRLGEKMFGFAAAYVWAGQLKDIVEQQLLTLPQHISQIEVNSFVTKCKSTIQEKLGDIDSKLAVKREIEMTYKTMPIKIIVNSTHEDIMCRLHCKIKESCAGGGCFPCLPFEEDIWPAGAGDPQHTASADVVADTKLARETFIAMFGDMKSTAALAKQFLTAKATLLHQLDKNWKIEEWGG